MALLNTHNDIQITVVQQFIKFVQKKSPLMSFHLRYY